MKLNSQCRHLRAGSITERGQPLVAHTIPRKSAINHSRRLNQVVQARATVTTEVPVVTENPLAVSQRPDLNGRFGIFGGQYVPENLVTALNELDAEYRKAIVDPEFQVQALPHCHSVLLLLFFPIEFTGKWLTDLDQRLYMNSKLFVNCSDCRHVLATYVQLRYFLPIVRLHDDLLEFSPLCPSIRL